MYVYLFLCLLKTKKPAFIYQQEVEKVLVFSPSYEEMKQSLNLKSKSGIHRLISALEERGFIKRLATKQEL